MASIEGLKHSLPQPVKAWGLPSASWVATEAVCQSVSARSASPSSR